MDTTNPRPEVVPGERIFLSQVRRTDLPVIAQWFSDLELTTYVGSMGVSFTLEDEEQWYENATKDKLNPTFAIIVREGQRVIGNCGLHLVNQRHGTAELGIAIGDKAALGQGYGSEAVRLVCDYAFTFMSLHTIVLHHIGFNERGHKAYLKAGFREVGRIRGAFLFNGQRYDDVLMDITRDDFGPTRSQQLVSLLNSSAQD